MEPDIIEAEGVEQAPSPTRDYSIPVLPYPELGEWRDLAACRTMGTTMFFGETGTGFPRQPLIDAAIAVCNTCSVRKQCFDYAKRNDLRHGVWGGIDFFVSTKSKKPRIIPDSID